MGNPTLQICLHYIFLVHVTEHVRVVETKTKYVKGRWNINVIRWKSPLSGAKQMKDMTFGEPLCLYDIQTNHT